MNRPRIFAGASAVALIATVPGMAMARDGAGEDNTQSFGPNDIIVTARKKSESDLSVPIAIRAISAEQLARQGIQNLQDVAAITPSLNVSVAIGNSGGAITLRGIGTPAAGPGTDQAVALNFDGVTVAEGLAVRLGQFDIAQVEILQGPQSLYFGKNSSGGIISVVSADPTEQPYAMLRAGYGFQARELLAEGVVSGQIAEGLGARLAFYRSDMEGYFKNPLAERHALGRPTPTQLALFGPLPRAARARTPGGTVTGIRGTLKYEPTDALTARFKGTWMKQDGSDTFGNGQLFNCPAGEASPLLLGNVAGIDDCKIDHYTTANGQNTTQAQGGDPLYRDGQPYSQTTQYLLSGNIDYDFADGVSMNSVTSYYNMKLRASEIVTSSPYPFFGSTDTNNREDFTQELRVSTDLDSPLNGMVGTYFQDGKFFATVSAYLFGIIPPPAYNVRSRTYSAFGQLTYDMFDKRLQIAAGGRYTDEKKDLTVDYLGGQIQDILARKTVRSKKFSPELTLSWRPNQHTNAFITYKKGTKSGGFSLSSLLPPVTNGLDISFEDENAEGFEGGVKTILFDGALRFDLTGYRYNYTDLQVTVYDPAAAVTGTRNAAVAQTYGVQLNTNYSSSEIPGLNIGASVNYGRARYKNYLAGCYVGQTQAEGCIFSPTGTLVGPGSVATSQDLSGRGLTAAPDWSGNINASYEMPVSNGDTRIGLSLGATYQDSFEILYNQPPGSRQKSAVNVDGTLRLFNDNSGWELSLIGKNLTDALRVRWAAEAPLSPGLGVPTNTGTNAAQGLRSDLLGITNAPRTIMLRLTVKLGSE